MKIEMEPGVKANQYACGTFVGIYMHDTPRHFQCGAYYFQSIYSANIFSYVFRKNSSKLARLAVEGFEKKLTGSGVQKNAFKKIISVIDWKTAATGNLHLALTGTLKNTIKAACDVVVDKAVKEALTNANHEHNPFTVGNSNDVLNSHYIDYMIGYWNKNPGKGPAYKSIAETVSPIKKEDQFNPFGWD